MSEDIRKMIDKVKNFKQVINENVSRILTTERFPAKFILTKPLDNSHFKSHIV